MLDRFIISLQLNQSQSQEEVAFDQILIHVQSPAAVLAKNKFSVIKHFLR